MERLEESDDRMESKHRRRLSAPPTNLLTSACACVPVCLIACACVCVCVQVAKIVNRFTGIFWMDSAATVKRPIESIDERSMAYGSTPFQSWHEIVMHPALQSALLAAARAPVPPPPPPGVSVGSEAEAPRGFLVLGSSIGWFPMLAYLQFVSECSI